MTSPDYWVAASKRDYLDLPMSIDLESAGVPAVIELTNGITVIGGYNGSAKTRTLREMARCLGDRAKLIEISVLVSWLLRFRSARSDSEDFAEEEAWYQLNSDDLDSVRAVIGRQYDEVSWASVDFEGSPFEEIVGSEEFPIFRASYGGREYSTPDMGDGELTVLIVFWIVWMLAEDTNAIVLLDEPDAFLSGPSRSGLVDYLAAYSVKVARPIVISSHSAEVLLPAAEVDGSLVVLQSIGGEITCERDAVACREVVDEMFRGSAGRGVVFFVEDEVASHLLYELLRCLDLRLAQRSTVFWLRGHGDVQRIVGTVPRPAGYLGTVSFVGVVDGDVADLASSSESHWPIVALPGGAAPEELIRSAVSAEPGAVAERLNVGAHVVRHALTALEGAEIHDWLNELVKLLDVSRSECIRILCLTLIRSEQGEHLQVEMRDGLQAVGLL